MGLNKSEARTRSLHFILCIYAWLLILRSSNSRNASFLEFDALKTKVLLKDVLVMFVHYVLTEVHYMVIVDMKRMSSRGQNAVIQAIK